MKKVFKPYLHVFWLVFLLFVETSQSFAQVSFTESAASYGLDLNAAKDGGMAFQDIDLDGDLDLLINTNSGSVRSRIYRNNNGNFTDVTATLAPSLSNNTMERQALWADFNNDGLPDFLRTTSSRQTEVYLQASSNGVFGDGTGGNSPILLSISNGYNVEGAGAMDYDGDGDLDIFMDNHDYGIEIYRNNYINHANGAVVNPAPGSFFTQMTTGTGTILGLPQAGSEGDYSATADINDDGWPDMVVRKHNNNDLYFNQGGTFGNSQNIDQANNGRKGGVGLYDLDNDGDYDLIWTYGDGTYVYRNDNGTFNRLTGNLSIQSQTDIDGVAGGDIDNDGDTDLIFTGNSKSYLYLNDLNNGSGIGAGNAFQLDLNSTFDNYTNNSGNGEGVIMVDIDQDGDLDIYENKNGSSNKLWINNLYSPSTTDGSKAYLVVDVWENRSDRMQSGKKRYAIGANVVLKDCNGAVISGIRSVNGGTGHGTQDPTAVYFGLPWGRDYNYQVEVRFTNDKIGSGSTTRQIISTAFNPAKESSFRLSVFSDGSSTQNCSVYQQDTTDTDADGVNDLTDRDDDNDGIPDVVEAYRGDHDGDGTADYEDAEFCAATFASAGWDCSNGLPDPAGDLDGDKVPNYRDSDFPLCGGLMNSVCSYFDTDGDSIPNHLDLDSDNDGIYDMIEAGGVDANDDGQADCQATAQTFPVSLTVTDNDGNASTHSGTVTVGSAFTASFDPNGTQSSMNNGGSGSSSSGTTPSCTTEAEPSASNWIIRNNWSDQNNGSTVTNASGALRLFHRAWGKEDVAILQDGAPFSVTSGESITISLDMQTYTTVTDVRIGIGERSSMLWYGYSNYVAPLTSVGGSFTSGSYTTKSITLTPTATISDAVLVIQVVSTRDGNNQVSLFQNLEVCVGSSGSSSGSSCTGKGDGQITYETYTGINGTDINDLKNAANYPNSPSSTTTYSIFEGPINSQNNYGVRMRGWICAPQTGNYTFWIASDDDGELWLSTNSDPANIALIASVDGWTNSQQWTKFTSQQSATISLQQGQAYYVEALMKDGGGGDNIAVGWQLPDGTLNRPISGTYLSSTTPTTNCGSAPTSIISVTGNSGSGPYLVNFSGNSSTDTDGSITSFAWDFGDGNTGTGAAVTHSFSITGSNDTDADGWCNTYDNAWGAFTGGTPLPYSDSDADGLDDAYEIDADDDGCLDTKEAEISDGDEDGIAGNSPVSIDNWGKITGHIYQTPSKTDWQDALIKSACSIPYLIINPHIMSRLQKP
ncbi:MAG: FG-GAP-like repeat-containing protein [Bacteroidota bacterium]